MKHQAIFIDDKNNQYEFRVDGNTVILYAECYSSAVKKLKDIYGKNIEILDKEYSK
jgi:hypothetical protein